MGQPNTPGQSPQPKNSDALRRKLDQVRSMVFQRVSEQQEALQKLVAKRERALQQHDDRIHEVLAGGTSNAGAHGEHQRVGDIEDVVREERAQARQRADREAEQDGTKHRGTPRKHPPPPRHDSSLLSTPIPKGGAERAHLAAKLEAERQELDQDLARAIQQLRASHCAEIEHIEAVATDIIGAVRPAEARQLTTEMSRRRRAGREEGGGSVSASPSRGLFQSVSVLDIGGLDDEDEDEDEDDGEAGDSANPFDHFFRHQLARLRALKRGGFAAGVSLEKEARATAEAGGRAAHAVWGMASAPGDADMTEKGVAAVLMLYLQSAVRHMPRLLAQSGTIASRCSALRGGGGGEDPRAEERRVQAEVQEVLKKMLDGSAQRSCHKRERGKATHACSLCVMEALGVGEGGDAVPREVFQARVCGALSAVVSAPRLVRAAERRGHQT